MFAIGAMLGKPPEAYVPLHWSISGVPRTALDLALEGGADYKAIEALENGVDPRLYAMKNYGWVRVSKNRFNMWSFDKNTADLIKNAEGYWFAQGNIDRHETIDTFEFKDRAHFTVTVGQLMRGGDPQVLKGLATVKSDVDQKGEALSPQYSSRLPERERRRLYARTGDNPSLRDHTDVLERRAEDILLKIASKGEVS